MNKAINEDFDYRKELKSLFDVPVGAIWDCIDKQDNNQHFWGIYHKDTILDPDYEFSDEIKEQVNNPIDQNSIWFSVESKHVIEIGTDYDLACFYDNYRESHCKSVDDIKDDILDNYIYFCQKHQHDNSLECEITDLFNDDVTNYLKHRNLNIDNCTVIGDISEFNDQYSHCKWFIVDNGSQNIYIYQDWDQVWENIIYDLLPGKWLKDFASK